MLQFVEFCSAVGHPGLAAAALTGRNKKVTYTAPESSSSSSAAAAADNDAVDAEQPLTVVLPARLGIYLRSGVTPRVVQTVFDECGLVAREAVKSGDAKVVEKVRGGAGERVDETEGGRHGGADVATATAATAAAIDCCC